MEENTPIGQQQVSLDQVVASSMIQTAFRKYRERKKLQKDIGKIGELDSDKNVIEKVDEEEMNKEVENSTKSIREIPYNAWIIVFSFTEGWKEFLEIQKVCKLFRKISNLNTCWVNFMRHNEPEIVEYVLEKNEKTNIRQVNWKVMISDSKREADESVTKLSERLVEIKTEGNQQFKDKKFEKAFEKYKEGIEKSLDFKVIDENPICSQFADRAIYLEILQNITILYSNAAQASINAKKWLSALEMARSAKRNIVRIQSFCQENNLPFTTKLEILEKKIIYRLKQASKKTFGLLRFVRYSENPVDGVQVGTIIKASDNISGDIFSNSQVLITQYERGGGVKGIIFNKVINLQNDSSIRIGGPCEMRVKEVLHNIPDVPGSIRILEGVYLGGNLEGIDQSNSIVREYFGYAAWFGGQLDGELRNSDWDFTNSVTADDIFTDDTIEFDISR